MGPPERTAEEGLTTRPDVPPAQVESEIPIASRTTRMRKRRPWWAVGIAVVLIGAVAVLAIVLTGHRQVLPFTPKRQAFTFTLTKTYPVSLQAKHPDAAVAGVAASVQSTLSAMYDGLFLDPHAWSTAPPSDVYDHFTDTAKPHAEKAGAGLGLGSLTGTISSLSVDSSKLTVHVLVGPNSKPTAAMATVEFIATAKTRTGSTLRIDRRAQYLLDDVGGTWLVSGFPLTQTTVDKLVPSPAPAGAGSAQSGSSS